MDDLYPHQRKAVDELANGKVLCGGVGTGKSRTSMQYYVETEAPRNLYVITTAKKRDSLDWLSEAARYGIGTRPEASVHGVLTVDSWNNINKYKGVTGAFFIFDEQRLVGSGAWVKAFLNIAKKNHWILLSATPGDTWLDYIPLFVANGLYANKTEFIRTHVVYSPFSKYPKVDHYVQTSTLLRHRDALLVDMPYVRSTRRHDRVVNVDYRREDFLRVIRERWNIFEDRPLLNVGELYQCLRKVTNSDPSRLEATRELLQTHQRLIIFYNFNYELAALRTLGDCTCSTKKKPSSTSRSKLPTSGPRSETEVSETCSRPTELSGQTASTTLPMGSPPRPSSCTCEPITLAEWNGQKHEEIPNTDRWVYLVQYLAGAEGWNCTSTDAILFYSLQYSYRIREQSAGRIDRLDTRYTDLYYYSLVSKAPIDVGIQRALVHKQSFNERRGLKYLGISEESLKF